MYLEDTLKFAILITLLCMLNACAQPEQYAYDTPASIAPVDSANRIQGQLILEFDPHVSLQQARYAVAACASSSSVMRQQPVMLLVILRTSQGAEAAAQTCLHAPGVVRAEWNQKRRLR